MNAGTASVSIGRPAETVFEFMSDPEKMDLWSFGTWRVSVQDDGLVIGRSIYDGSTVFVRIQADRQKLLIDYAVGSSRASLEPRIFVRVTPGTVTGASPQTCVLSMVAFQTEGMDDGRWQKLLTAHAFEVELIKSLLENDFDHRTLPPSGPVMYD